jgi:hypothetical protein
MKIKQRATIVLINDINKVFEVKISDYPKALEVGENGNVLPLSVRLVVALNI